MQKNKKNIHPGVAVVAGVFIGAAGTAVAAALAHEPTRKKMSKTLQDVKIQVGRSVQDFQKSSRPMVKKAQDTMKSMSDTMQSSFDQGREHEEKITH